MLTNVKCVSFIQAQHLKKGRPTDVALVTEAEELGGKVRTRSDDNSVGRPMETLSRCVAVLVGLVRDLLSAWLAS